MKHIAVILSGSGFMDGSEIHESVACLYALDKAQFKVSCFAPHILQNKTVNHLTQEERHQDARCVLEESARIARGDIQDLSLANPEDFHGAVYPGGYGAALNLSTFASQGADFHVQEDVFAFAQAMANARKPQLFACISPVLIPKIYGSGVRLTIGNDQQIANLLEQIGAIHIDCDAKNFVCDEAHCVFSTPAYMVAKNISEVFEGIDKTVQAMSQYFLND